jgi:uncharacterized protein YecT (DUF1311 family)
MSRNISAEGSWSEGTRYRAAWQRPLCQDAIRQLVWPTVLVAFFTATAFAQTATPPSPAAIACKSARTTVARLICADPDLAAADSRLSTAFQGAQAAASADMQKSLAKQQLIWLRERDQKCIPAERNYAPIAQPLSGKQCLEDAIKARIDVLQNDSQTGSTPQTSAASDTQNIIMTPVTTAALIWRRERDQKCGLRGLNYSPVARLLSSKQCLENAIGARIDDLQNGSQTGSIVQSSVSDAQGMIMASATVAAFPSPAATACKSARTAAAELICADPHLAAVDSALSIAFRDVQAAASPNVQKSLAKQQLIWMQERDQKCGLTGKTYTPFSQPLSGKQCLEDAIRARIDDLQGDTQTGSIPQISASNTQNIVMTPVIAVAPPSPAASACKSARNAAARLICADLDLAAADSKLNTAFQETQAAAPPDMQRSLARQQLTWMQERDQKCGLTEKTYAPIAQPLPGKECLEDAIKARIDDLKNDTQTGSISQNSASDAQSIIITPVMQPAVLLAPANSGSNELPTFQELGFSAPAGALSGTIICSSTLSQQGNDSPANMSYSGKWIVKIAIKDDTNSYRMFENDAWVPFLDNLRNAVQSACASALKSGRLRNSANEQIGELPGAFEVYSPQGLFMAYSIGQNTPWTLQTNLPKARRAVQTNLGIDTWVKPSQLGHNPYFFKDSLVGMVIQFDHMLSDNEALFMGPGAQVFVSGVPPALFQSKEQVVLAGRVTGNKGLISPSGSETLLPALDYVGAYKCGNTCAGF